MTTTTTSATTYPLPSVQTLERLAEVIQEFLRLHMAPVHTVQNHARSELLLSWAREFVAQVFQESEPPEMRTPEMILLRVGELCRDKDIAPHKGAEELYQQLNALLRGGGKPMEVPR